MEEATGSEQQKYVEVTATGKVPEIRNPEYFFDENNNWVFVIPEDVIVYLKKQFGDEAEIQVQGNQPQNASAGYCCYNAVVNGKIVGGIRLGGRSTQSLDGRTGVRSEWKLFSKQAQ